MSTEYPPTPPSWHQPEQAEANFVSPDGASIAWAPQKFRHKYWLHAALFVATILTTTVVGGLHYASFVSDFGARRLTSQEVLSYVWPEGFWFSGTLLLILGAHELGHYFACRRHDVDASLPYFLPVPPIAPELAFAGTIGAFIRVRERFPDRRVLFDVGVAGPLAGFAVLVPALFLGMALSNLAIVPTDFEGVNLGEPLLFRAAAALLWREVPQGYSINMHPMVLASWFGMLATALNLMPFGQLDGGHIAYAWLGRRASRLSVLTVLAAITLSFVSVNWVVWTILMLVMLAVFGLAHPPVMDPDRELDPTRRALAIASFVVFAICFMPIPMTPLGLG